MKRRDDELANGVGNDKMLYLIVARLKNIQIQVFYLMRSIVLCSYYALFIQFMSYGSVCVCVLFVSEILWTLATGEINDKAELLWE